MLPGPLGPVRPLGMRMAPLRGEAGPRAGMVVRNTEDVTGIPEEEEELRLFGRRRGCLFLIIL